MTSRFNRRTLLRGAGVALALPWFESLRAAGGQARPPVRTAFYIVGGGAYMPFWTIDASGRREELEPQKAVEYKSVAESRNEPLTLLSPTLEPLTPHKDQLLVLGGLTLADPVNQFEDGHSPEIATLLTAAPLNRDRLQCGVSCDQYAAQRLARFTYLDSLVVGLNGARPGGSRGLGRIYAQHYSWRTPSTPTGEERNPRLAFDRMFRGRAPASGDTAAARHVRASGTSDSDRRSVLDLIRDDARRLRGELGGGDRQKLDEYLHAIREVEGRIEFVTQHPADPQAPSLDAGEEFLEFQSRFPTDRDIPESYVEYDHLMVDLLVLALQTDTTRVGVVTHGGYRSYPEVEVKRGHHDCQHHEGNPEKRLDLQKIDRFNVGLFSYFLERMTAVREGDGTLLDNAMVLYASGMSNGNRHARENLPILLAGRAGGTFATGRCVDFNWKRRTPLANLYVEMLNRAGVPTQKFGDSTGGLPELAS